MNNLTSAKVVQHTKHFLTNSSMITLELEMPRIVLAELNTHKILVRNCQSSRAVPIKSTVQQLLSGNNFVPSYWGRKQSGMSASEENNKLVIVDDVVNTREETWLNAMREAIKYAEAYDQAEYHKQIAGRLLEPFMMVRVLLSGTEWDNFYNLRTHPTAEPHFRDLAVKIYNAVRESKPFTLNAGEWHLPYIEYDRNLSDNKIVYLSREGKDLSLEEAINISLSCNAQTSYRKHDSSIEKANDIVDKLFGADSPVHASPAEHIATPMKRVDGYVYDWEFDNNWEEGVTHMDRNGDLWSGQLKHFIQYRQLIPNHVCNDFTHEKFLEYTKEKII